MPEGDAIFKDARRLRPVLEGQVVEGITCRWPRVVQGLEGAVIERLTTHGKNLVLHFSVGVILRVHRQMSGSWCVDAGRIPGRDLRLSIRTSQGVADLYDAPTIERIDARALDAHPVLSALGPDVLAEGFHPEEAVSRAPPEMPVGLALLDQRVAAGLGNIYRAETLFYERQDPFMPLREVREPGRLWARGRSLMLRNVAHDRIVIETREGHPINWVYDRARQPCLRCRTRIQAGRLGGMGRDGVEQLVRTVWWCPRCQPRPGGQ